MNAGHAADTMDKRVRERIRMNMSPKEYNRYVARLAKKSPLGKDLLNSFLIGGLICVIGQLILNGYTALELSEQDAAAATSVSLVFLSAVLTGLSVYDDLAKIAGAGTLVPITGFANAVVSPAIEFKAEGFVTGMAAKMFIIAGPVIVYGTVASVLYGIILVIFGG
jgi:stage V sporulation protein AC